MKTSSLWLFLASFILSSVVRAQTRPVKLSDSISVSIEKQTDIIYNYIAKHNNQLILFAKLPGKKVAVKVKNQKWPDEVDDSYNIFKDSTGKVIFIADMPFSESGDWYIEYRHYFDSNGNTIAFERITNVFDSDIKGGLIYETLVNYYSPGLKLRSKEYTLKRKDGKNIKDSGHVDIYHYPYHIYRNVNDCLKAYNIPISN